MEITRGIANWVSARDILENKELSRGFEKVNYRRLWRRLWDNAPGRRAVWLVND
ncbi:MAG TPA: hypothetical protein VJL10_09345 [Anaerolineales bacterium]|nr:hypothetical protein [Anaerolineales bacterium]